MTRYRSDSPGWPAVLVCALCLWVAPSLPTVWAAETDGGKVGVAELDPKTEAAIDRGLKYLAGCQREDGSWGEGSNNIYRVAITSLALMAFMLKGDFPEKGEYGQKLDKGVKFVLQACKDGNGYVGTNMYQQGLAMLALSEAWGMSQRKEIRDALKKGVEIILRAQSPAGGWRYEPRPSDADISVTVMQIVALSSAKEAGIYVPDKTIEKAIAYVKGLQEKSSGGFGYGSPTDPGFARTAAGAMSLLMCGENSKSTAVRNGLKWLTDQPADIFKKTEFYYYGHYYAVQAMYQAGDSYYQAWYPKIRNGLLSLQGKDGSWTGEAGVAYGTSLAILILGVPYRYLPIYQR